MAFDWQHYLLHTWKKEDMWTNSLTVRRDIKPPECEVVWEVYQVRTTSYDPVKVTLQFQWSLLEMLEDLADEDIPMALAGGGLSSMGPNWKQLWDTLAVPYLTARLQGTLEGTEAV